MYGLLFIIAIIIIILFFQNYQKQLQQCSSQHKETQNQLKQKISSLEKNLNQVQSQTRQVTSSPPIENYQSDIILPNVATNNFYPGMIGRRALDVGAATFQYGNFSTDF